MRTAQFANDAFYHIYNRGVDKREVFLRSGQYSRFIQTIILIMTTGSATKHAIYNQSLALSTKVEIVCYSLLPNHYHFLLHQIGDNGITEFMHKLDTSYTKYFNQNNHRTGRLFKATFKAKIIDCDELLLHVSRYIHLNPLIAHLTNDIAYYQWSSYPQYLSPLTSTLCNTKIILDFFDNDPNKYAEFINDQIEYAQLLKQIELANDDEDMLFL